MTAALFLLAVCVAASAAPAKNAEVTRLLYDQRQEGELNLHADLKNIVVLVIPTVSSTSSPSAGSIADFLFRALPKRGHFKKAQQKKDGVLGEETLHFIESKTAPYHVDISRSRNHLAKLRPETPVVDAEEIVIAESPTIALVKDEGRSRTARAFVLTVPAEGEEGKNEEKKKKDSKKKSKEAHKSPLKLIGAENDEECGPGLYRDAEGVCRVIKN